MIFDKRLKKILFQFKIILYNQTIPTTSHQQANLKHIVLIIMKSFAVLSGIHMLS